MRAALGLALGLLLAAAAHAGDVPQAALPGEARETIARIQSGGPFPWPRDGAEFRNREHRLPGHARGYYHEYTVATPGRSDRGARRVVTGLEGELYYSDDHYRSFRRVRE
ncbi:MAG: ribonuclease domain-containing protein [Burkholderiales bacterium]